MRLWGLSVVALVLVSASACSDQAEGERCDQQNGSNDCSAGLVCTPVPQSLKAPAGASICCPPPGTSATVAACRTGSASILTDGGAVTDAGNSTTDAARTDGAP
jgi:hypothetical protein